MLASDTLSHSSHPSSSLSYHTLNRAHQAYICVLKGLTDLIFDPPILSSKLSTPTASFQSALPTATSLPGYPETSFLDSARLVALSTDAADTTAMYMFLMLYRQLVFFNPNPRNSTSTQIPRVTESDLAQLKIEIRDIASCHLGYCFIRTSAGEFVAREGSTKKAGDKEWEKWRRAARDVILQIAMRATEVQNRTKISSTPTDHPFLHQAPDQHMLQLAERWLDTNLRHGSNLSVVLRDRLRDAVFHRLVATTFPTRDVSTGKLKPSSKDGASLAASTTYPPPLGTVTGMESLTDEIRTLADKLSKLALIHLGVYLPLYEQDGFIQS